MAEQVPNFLTIEEAARVLRIGRTKAYAMGQEWRVTNGKSGIKVREVGGQLRVPKAWLEAQLDAPLLFIPEPPQRANGNDPKPAPAPPEPEPSPTPAPASPPPPPPKKSRPRNRRRTDPNQLTLPFS